jgi:hypothetical protein
MLKNLRREVIGFINLLNFEANLLLKPKKERSLNLKMYFLYSFTNLNVDILMIISHGIDAIIFTQIDFSIIKSFKILNIDSKTEKTWLKIIRFVYLFLFSIYSSKL